MFPALENVVWLNTPTVAPGATPVLEALRRVQAEWEDGRFSWQGWEAEAEQSRALFARLMGTDASSIALVPSVSEAAATVARALPLGRVVVGEREFRSNLFPWLQLRDFGYDVVEVAGREGLVSTGSLVEAIDGRTALVAITEVQSSNGFRVDVRAIADRCRQTGARLFVNLTQSLGALRFPTDDIRPDFAAAHAYKWLLAPRGAAYLYVRPDRIADLVPLAPSWKTVAKPYDDYYGGPLDLAPGARRFDASLAWFPWVGARAALDILLSLDAATVERRCLLLAEAFREGARRRGFRMVPVELPSQTVGLVVNDPEATRSRLERFHVVGAVRGGFLRLGFHAFNVEADVEAALATL